MTSDPAIEHLDDYERGLGDDVDAYEDDLFERALAGDAPELVLRDSLSATLHEMGRRGTIDLFPSARDVAELRARTDLRVAYAELGELVDGKMVATKDADVVITRVPIPLAGVTRLEVEVGFEGAGVLKTMPDVTFDREDGAVYFCCDGALARSIVGRPFGRFWSIDGERRTFLAEVVVDTSG